MVRATRGGVASACLLVGLAACQSDGGGGGAIGLVGITAGARLRPVAWYAAGGAALFDHWDDAALATECAFELAVDGRWRCLPSGAAAIDHDDAAGFFFFADAACTAPLSAPQPGSPTPRYVLGPPRVTPACDEAAGRPVYEVGAVFARSTAYRVDQGGCVEVSIEGPFTFHEVGDEIAADEFVAAELVAQAGAGRLAPYAFVAEDGAREARAIWDGEREEECAEREGACRPVALAFAPTWLWADEACEVPAASFDGASRACATATGVTRGADDLSELGAPVPSANVYVSIGPCAPPTPDVVLGEVFEIGAPVDPATLAPLEHLLDGAGRVRARRSVTGAGAELTAAAQLHDTDLDEPCFPTRFLDGARCVPSVVAIAAYFADAACGEPLIYAGGDLPPHAFVYPDDDGGPLPPTAPQVYRPGPLSPITEPYMRDEAGACRPWREVNPNLPVLRFATLGERVELPVLELH